MQFDLSVVYYTSNYLDTANPYFLENTKKQLVKAIGDYPLIVVSQKPVEKFEGYKGEYQNVCIGDIGRSHLNIYRQILMGCKAAKTEFVAMAEDDILYSYEHFHHEVPKRHFLYDMNKVSLFTWTKPPLFSFRTRRKVINQLIARRTSLIEALEERFRRVEELLKTKPESEVIKYWGDIGRYERLLQVTPREVDEFYCTQPSIVFSHEDAFGYLNQGSKKRLGDVKIVELYGWGRAEDVLRLHTK